MALPSGFTHVLPSQLLIMGRGRASIWVSWSLVPSLGPQVIIICLVVLDTLLVLAELILDLRIIQPDKKNYAAMVGVDSSSGVLLICFACVIRTVGVQSGAADTPLGVARSVVV